MASTGKVIASILLLCFLLNGDKAGCTTASSADGNQMWGYTQVRPKAHLFWWFYKSPQRVSSPAKQWPTVLWLQGGPGGSGVGGGNFMGVGPLDTNLKPRNSTWLQKADLVFNLFEYLYDQSRSFFSHKEKFELFNHSFGSMQLSYAELLHQVSRLDANDVAPANKIAAKVKDEMAAGQFAKARITWVELSNFIDSKSATVNWENFMLESFMTHQSGLKTIDGIMNGVVKQKLKIIPKDVVWQRASIPVNDALDNVFMKPAINEVDELLAYGVVVAIYNGQFDLICSTVGVEGWVRKLKWDGLKNFLSLPRQDVFVCDTPVHCSGAVRAFRKTYQNLHFYWILGAGHTVPVDQPDVALQMIGQIVAT